MACGIYRYVVDSNVHALLKCSLAEKVWDGCCFDGELLVGPFKGLRDRVELAAVRLDEEQLGEFMAIAWECLNACNHFLFGIRDVNPEMVGGRAISFICSFREVQKHDHGD